MKYLIKNQKEFIISLGVFVTIALIIFWCVWSIVKGCFDHKNLIAIVGVIFEVLGWYHNIPTSEENDKYTSLMRLEKAQKKAEDFVGENFFDDTEELEEDDVFIEDDEEEGAE